MKVLKLKNQHGQALISGLIFLVFSMLCVAFFLFISESFYRVYSNINKEREYRIKENSFVANKINQLSINNQYILSALSVAQNAFAESTEIGLYVSYFQPYWLTYGFINKNSSNDKFENIGKKNALSMESEKYVNNAFKTYRLKSARGLYIAISLAEKNEKIINSLPQNIKKYFMQSSNSEVFCLALASQSKNYGFPGFFNIPLLENLYNFYIDQDECQLSHYNSSYRVVNKILPFLSDAEPNLFLDYNKMTEILKKSTQFGVYFVSFSQAKNFLNELYIDNYSDILVNPKFTKISNYLSKIPFFSSLNLSENVFLQSVPKNIYVRISHPYFVCSGKSSWQGDFLQEKDWKKEATCLLSRELFYKSFFTPHWAAFVTQEEGKNEYF
ncbi:hypothetical protein [Fluviispira multicolorata]|uniref:Uncharacterized protein n=1 Tax=Fluviispira multicolorata TaxID=2654512 RepID=A0A833N7Q0_9BACT|nr:hypothetical protein [Fluviispira multicolorata]KAB8033221.1 hypothetical protein GCL57_00560 [Fluviispira multicolorata]